MTNENGINKITGSQQDYIAGIAGKSFTYKIGAQTYTITFKISNSTLFGSNVIITNAPWYTTAFWEVIGPDKVQLTNAGKKLILTFSNATTYSGIDWDGVTKISGSQISGGQQDYTAGIAGKSFTFSYENRSGVYNIFFGANGTITTNAPFVGTTTWKVIGPDRVSLNNAYELSIMVFSSATKLQLKIVRTGG